MKKFFPSVGQKRPRSEMVDLTCDTVDAPLKESALTSHPLSVDIAPSTATEATALSKNAFNTLMDRAKKASARPNSFEIFHIHLNPKGCSWYWSDKTGQGDNAPSAPSWKRTIHYSMSKEDDRRTIELRYSSSTNTLLRPTTPGISLSAGAFKSLLQKAVRRRMKAETERIAGEFFALDAISAVRRGMIVVIEDAILHPAYPLLCWILLALSSAVGSTPVLVPSDEILVLFSYIMGEVASSNIKDPSWRFFVNSEKFVSEQKEQEKNEQHLLVEDKSLFTVECTSLVRSIHHRLRFGGQDNLMLSNSKLLWIQRFKSTSSQKWLDLIHSAYGNTCSLGSFGEGILSYSRSLQLPFPSRLMISDLPIFGIDNNVLPQMIHDLRSELTLTEKEDLNEWSRIYYQNIFDDKMIGSILWLVNGNLNLRTLEVTNDPIPSPVQEVEHKARDIQLVQIFSRAHREFAMSYLRQRCRAVMPSGV